MVLNNFVDSRILIGVPVIFENYGITRLYTLGSYDLS